MQFPYDPPFPALKGANAHSFAHVTLRDRLPVILTQTIDALCRFIHHASMSDSALDDTLMEDEPLLHRIRTTLTLEQRNALDKQGKNIIAALSRLRYELQCNKPMRALTSDEQLPAALLQHSLLQHQPDTQDVSDEDVMRLDMEYWNRMIARFDGEGRGTWFDASWLFIECYLYRRVMAAFASADAGVSEDDKQATENVLKSTWWSWCAHYDAFGEQKRKSFFQSLSLILDGYMQLDAIVTDQQTDTESAFQHFLQNALWGNQVDLSMNAGRTESDIHSNMHTDRRHASTHYMLANDSQTVWQYFQILKQRQPESDRILDIVLDNAGAELAMDLCFADWVLQAGFFDRVRFHMKVFPWFVSDVTARDMHWMLNEAMAHLMKQGGTEKQPALTRIQQRWSEYQRSSQWTFHTQVYWNWGCSYWHMCEDMSASAWSCMQQSALVLFKGDLNYRKLIYDCAYPYPYDTPFAEAIGPCLRTLPVVTLRTCKADVVAGLSRDIAPRLDKNVGVNHEAQGWLVTGKYALLQAHLAEEEREA